MLTKTIFHKSSMKKYKWRNEVEYFHISELKKLKSLVNVSYFHISK